MHMLYACNESWVWIYRDQVFNLPSFLQKYQHTPSGADCYSLTGQQTLLYKKKGKKIVLYLSTTILPLGVTHSDCHSCNAKITNFIVHFTLDRSK